MHHPSCSGAPPLLLLPPLFVLPGRTTILTGECAHNSGVVNAWGPTLGGFHRFTT